jgi:hypothetical protein
MTVLVPLANIDLHEMLPMVVQHCPNASSAGAAFWVRQAAIEFCRRSLAYQVTLPVVQTLPEQALYTISADAWLQVAKLLSCKVGGRRMSLVTPAEMDGQGAEGPGRAPEAAAMAGTNTLLLYPTPTAEEPILARCAMEPSQEAAALPTDLFAQYAQAIAWGAIKWLAMTPEGRDPKLAAAAGDAFEAEIGKASAATYFNRARSGPRTTPTWC